MSARAAIVLTGMLLGLAAAHAQPRIPTSDMAGRERDRFIESPAERLMTKPVPAATMDAPRGKRTGKRKKR